MIEPGDRIIVDACLGPYSHCYVSGPMCKINSFKTDSLEFLRSADRAYCASRVIIENFFGTVKNQYRLFRWYTASEKNFTMFWRCAIALVNIYLVMQSNGLRRWMSCTDSSCYFCVHILHSVWNPSDSQVEAAVRYQ